MNYRDFLKDIKNHELKPVYLCYGTESYLKNLIINDLKAKYIDPAFETLNYIYLDGKEVTVDGIINACETLPFMAEKKIVVIEDLVGLSGGKGTLENEEDLIDYLLKIGFSTCLMLIVNEEKIDNRKKIVKKVKEVGSIIELNKIKDDELSKWILKGFKKYNKNIDKGDIYYFIEGTGYFEASANKSLYDLENEITKICNYIGDRSDITRADIDKILVKSLQNNIFKLVDGLGQKKPHIALSLFNEMLLNNEPLQLIMYMIIRQFRLIFMAKLLEEKGYSQGDIASKAKVPGFIAQKLIAQSRNFTKEELMNILERCLEIEAGTKTGAMDGKLAVEILISSY